MKAAASAFETQLTPPPQKGGFEPLGFMTPWQRAWRGLLENPQGLQGFFLGSLVVLALGWFAFLPVESWIQQQHQQQLEALLQTLRAGLLPMPEKPEFAKGTSYEERFRRLAKAALKQTPVLVAIQLQSPKEGASVWAEETVGTEKRLEASKDGALLQRSTPLKQGHPESLTLTLRYQEQPVLQQLRLTRVLMFGPLILAWVVALLSLLQTTKGWMQGLRLLTLGVGRLSGGDFGYKIETRPLWGELQDLGQSINDMSLRLREYETANIDTLTLESNKLEAVLQSIGDGVIVCEDSGEVVLVNAAALHSLGIQQAETLLNQNIGRYVSETGALCFAPVLKDYSRMLQEAAQRENTPERRRPLSQGSLEEVGTELFSQTVDTGKRTLKLLLSPIQDSFGERLGFVMILHDITRQAEVDRLKTHFISNVSHELRTPVTTIKSYIDTLYHHGQDLDETTYREFLETVHTETERLKKLVNDILDFARLEEGRVRLEMQWQDVSPVISLTVQSVKVLAQQKNLTLSTNIESNLPQVYLNSESIERVIRNLLSNAIKYTEDGGRIRVKAELTNDGQWVEVSVEDSGVGIAAEHIPYLFDRFYRVENKVHTVKGTGLGLHLVRVAIEEYHQGKVFVESTLGQGSRFGFRLPLQPETVAELNPEHTNNPKPRSLAPY
jgi:two-component system, OmpR family, sensor histidine kinase NblS